MNMLRTYNVVFQLYMYVGIIDSSLDAKYIIRYVYRAESVL
jgi:hypothetical protein